MKILALIPARGGSKRIPGKNMRDLGAKPLILWSLDSAQNITEICDIIVSTDDIHAAETLKRTNALVPWLRPAALASDSATSIDVAIHALDWYEGEKGKVDGLLLLQPTSPFRRRETILRGIKLYRENQLRPVIGLSPTVDHPMWCFKVEGLKVKSFIENSPGINLRSQDLPPSLTVNGGFYLISPSMLRANKSFYDEGMLPLVVDDPIESIDIDTEWDWTIAEAALKKLQ